MGSKVNDEEFTNILVSSLVVSFPRTRYLYTSMVVVVVVSGGSLIYIRLSQGYICEKDGDEEYHGSPVSNPW